MWNLSESNWRIKHKTNREHNFKNIFKLKIYSNRAGFRAAELKLHGSSMSHHSLWCWLLDWEDVVFLQQRKLTKTWTRSFFSSSLRIRRRTARNDDLEPIFDTSSRSVSSASNLCLVRADQWTRAKVDPDGQTSNKPIGSIAVISTF